MPRRRAAPARGLDVAVVQLAVPPPEALAHLDALADHVLGALLAAADPRPDLVVLPGLAALLPALTRRRGPASLSELVRRGGPEAAEIWLDWCRGWARMLGIALCAGSGVVERGGRGYHAAWLIDPAGRVILEQAQVQLPPADAALGLAAGDALEPVDLGGVPVGIAVGSDAFYPETGRILALQGALLLLCPLALPAPYDPWRQRAGAWSQVQGNQVYAVEACLVGPLADRRLAGRSACLAPVELTPGGDGDLARAPDPEGPARLRARLDFQALRELRRAYPVLQHLHPGLYRRCLLPAYGGTGEEG